ncbi:MAG: TonB-dependent receptor plug domain-containing protein [Flavobacteriales bacterium]|nr:TonB-dependent receptor plug domain-containing protein [Flavobacteriales bacterium]MCB9166710.1 TonB-dependent receptor plug domain-containing protein [Flavobacteriales bacterium]
MTRSSAHRPHCRLTRATLVFATSVLPVATLLAQVTDTTGSAADTARAELRAQLPVHTVTASDLESELGSQDISGILQSSRDIFSSTAGYSFGPARFRIRGLDGENNDVLINGIQVNDPEAGWATWSQWGGLNDVTRNTEIRTGNTASRYLFSGIGGYSAIDVRASGMRKGLRVSYALSNRSYDHRVMATWSSGLLKSGWAFSISGSRRWAEEGYVEGTFYDAWAYFLSAEKRLSDRHTIGLVAFAAPLRVGRQGLATEETHLLTNNNYYNPYWGFQSGEKRNARISTDNKPMFILRDDYQLDDRTKLTTSLHYTFGRDGVTGLNWYDAADPRPDYYRYLPSYYTVTDPAYASTLTTLWEEDPAARQIDWDQLYFANRKNLFTVQNADGIAGYNVTGDRSKYIVEDVRNDLRRMGVNAVAVRNMNARSDLTAGVSFIDHVTHNYKLVDDLLGGDFWVDVDQFAEQDFSDPSVAQNDLGTPNHVVREGDRFGWDYDMHVRELKGFAQYEVRWSHLELYAAGMLGCKRFWREGFTRNGRFPDNSLGNGDMHKFLQYGLKGGAVYKFSGRHYVTANAAYLDRPPQPRNAYVSPRTRDEVVPGLTTEKVTSADLNYVLRFPRLKGRATLYYAKINDQVWSRSFYHDVYRTLVNYSMSGLDERHTGVELGLEANATSTITISAVYAGGRYVYTSRPLATITRDNSSEVVAQDRLIYLKNYRVGGMPQTAAALGVKYNSPKYWFVSLTGNYFGHIYLDPNPDRRSAEALDNFVVDDPQWHDLLDQTRLDDGVTLDLFGGKSWMIQRKYRLALTVSISNILDNTDLAVGGYEQLRYERTDVDKFPPKLGYLYGRTYFIMLGLSL